MRGATRSTFASLALGLALAGCSTGSWQFWKSSSPVATAHPVVRAPEPGKAEYPAAAVEAEAAVPPAANFTALPGLPDVRFRPGQLGIVKSDEKVLDTVVKWLKAHPTAVVMLEGHTDDLGTRESNRVAAESRAASIKSYLVANGVEPVRIAIEPVGSERPLCFEKTDTCRARNRRVHVLVRRP
jgi:outer membrane protein OmpA-like peptidoglycan-associated protein